MAMKRWIVAVALLVLPGLAGAAPALLTFDNPTQDGGVALYSGAGGALTASDVVFQQVIGVGTPLNDGVELFCYPVNCLLDFTTGSNLTEGPPAYTFAGGGSLTLTGGLNTAADGSGLQVSPAGTLLAHDGAFRDPSLVLGGGGSSLLFVGVGSDLKDVTLTDFYGVTGSSFDFANTELSLANASFDPVSHAFSAQVTDADFANAAVPEPGTLLLFGSMLTLVPILRRRLHG
jgi:hypothetical protein